jgi:plasmid replication initiation protein
MFSGCSAIRFSLISTTELATNSHVLSDLSQLSNSIRLFRRFAMFTRHKHCGHVHTTVHHDPIRKI